MVDTREIWIPCDTYNVKVRVGRHEHLSPLELLLLQAVTDLKLSQINELAGLLSIGLRPTLDLAFDLWRRGYLLVNMVEGTILPAAHLLDKKLEELERLQGGEQWEDVRELLLDRLAGVVMPARIGGLSSRPPESPGVAPASYFEVSLKDVNESQLLAALQWAVEQEERGVLSGDTRPKKVLGAHLTLSDGNSGRKRRWLRLYVKCFRDSISGNLRLEFVDCPLPANSIAKIQRRLLQLIEDDSGSAFVRYLTEGAEVGETVSLEDELSRLEERIQGLAAASPGARSNDQRDCIRLAGRLQSASSDQHDVTLTFSPVISADDHLQAMADLIRGARRQIVIVTPHLNRDRLQLLKEPVYEAMKRGVQFFLLWGFNEDETLDAKYKSVSNFILALQQDHPRRFFCSQRSSRVSANLVVQDDSAILLSSCNLLMPPRGPSLEFGVTIEVCENAHAAAAGTSENLQHEQFPCPQAETALDWVWQRYPDYDHKQFLYQSFSEFRRHDAPGDDSADETCLAWPVAPLLPSGHDPWKLDETEDGTTSAAAMLWQSSWEDYCLSMRDRIAQNIVAARVLIDSEHRDVLADSLQSTRRRLLIAADRLGPEVVNTTFLNRLERLLQNGVFVTLMHQRRTIGDDTDHSAIEARFVELSENPDFGGRFRRIQCNFYCRFMVADDTVVVSSFDLLSHAGSHASTRPVQGRRHRSDMGVVIVDHELANRLLESVRAVADDAVSSWPDSDTETCDDDQEIYRAPIDPELQQRLLLEITESWEEPPANVSNAAAVIRRHIAGHLARSADGEAREEDSRNVEWLLGRLVTVNFPRELMWIAVAATVSDPRFAGDPSPWTQWLAEDAWKNRSHMEAAILCAGGLARASTELPTLGVLALAAGWDNRMAAGVICELAGDIALNAMERRLLAKAALVEFLLRGNDEVRRVADESSEALPEAWKPIEAAFSAYYQQVWTHLPMEAIQTRLDSHDLDQKIDDAWNHLDDMLSAGESVTFKFDSGTKTHEWLFHEEGQVFGRLRKLQQKRDAPGIFRWLKPAGNGPWITELGQLIDHATEQADHSTRYIGKKGGHGKRRSYLKNLNAIVSAAQEVVAISRPDIDEPTSHQLELAADFAGQLVDNWASLQSEMHSLADPEQRLTSLFMNELRPIEKWGKRNAGSG